MRRVLEDFTETEQNDFQNRYNIVNAILGTKAADWTSNQSNDLIRFITLMAKSLMNSPTITLQDHLTKMAGHDAVYKHEFRMLNYGEYRAAWSYRHDGDFRAQANGDENIMKAVVAGMQKYPLLAVANNPYGVRLPDDNAPIVVTPPPSPTLLEQRFFRGRNDDALEATWKANTNTNWSQPVNTNFRIRFQALSDHSREWVTGYQLWFKLNNMDWSPVLPEETLDDGTVVVPRYVKAASSMYLGLDSTLAPIFTPLSSETVLRADTAYGSRNCFSETRFVWNGKVQVEHEFVLQLVGADLAIGNVIEFQLRRGGAPGADIPFTGYVQSPKLTIS